jgi:hypothetical protein
MAVRNRKSAILAEGSGGDPDARGRLTTLVLRPVDHADDPLNEGAIVSHRDDPLHLPVLFDVCLEDRVEYLVRRKRVLSFGLSEFCRRLPPSAGRNPAAGPAAAFRWRAIAYTSVFGTSFKTRTARHVAVESRADQYSLLFPVVRTSQPNLLESAIRSFRGFATGYSPR